MKIKEITEQNRRDFTAIYECENCGHTQKGNGYDDRNFHDNVVPMMVCPACGASAPASYRPLATMYEEGQEV